MHTLYIDRTAGDLYGVLTLQRVDKYGDVVKVFEKLPFASGQFPFLDGGAEDWVQGKGPTPFGEFWMSTKKEPLTSAEPKGTPFYVFSTEKGGRTIKGPNGEHRDSAGLHLDGGPVGTVGCTGLRYDTPYKECSAWALFAYLDRLHKYEPWIKVKCL